MREVNVIPLIKNINIENIIVLVLFPSSYSILAYKS